eukprot:TRINITY_DN65964_c1_g1_i1.p1 TRINITY_DN65964_c1_g1~~TRINITY_DN65964_c1_g1_i1.p1  ORF type:complete len:1207 (+),score=234.46 TRINITY_DN65964_c1_g1_i1:31-3621(+)
MAISAGAVAFFRSPEWNWTLGKVDSLDPKNTFTCTGSGVTKGTPQETCSKLKEDDVFVIQNQALIDECPDDLLLLTLLHDSTLMHALNSRYYQDVIYTYIGPIVVAINPFKYTIPWYQDAKMPDYLAEGEVIKKNKPHSWAVAHNTYHEMMKRSQNQCVLVSGESGAGKTEAVKIVMKYLGAIASLTGTDEQKAGSQAVGHKLMQASPILEGFGNAKTVRNDNSSRFGKFVKVQFDTSGFMKGAHTTKYLLEKSRIVTAAENERCYHAFYLLAAGKDHARFGINNAAEFKFINSGNCIKIDGVDDGADYQQCLDAMTSVGLTDEEKDEVWKTVAGVMNLLTMNFIPDGEYSKVDGNTEKYLDKACELWQVDKAVLGKELVSTTREARGEKFTKLHTVPQATDSRDALAKATYNELFGWLVDKLNVTTSVESFDFFCGLLDIFGFECFKVNSFEQLCINLANETLQHHYNTYIFNKDMDECRAEGVDVTMIEFPDNTPCVKLITDKMGVIALLDEQCALGKGTDEAFLADVCSNHAKHPFFEKKTLAKTSFIIKHYAGDVSYEIAHFLDKNRDTLKDDMKVLMRKSNSFFIKELLPEPVDKAGKKITVGGFFRNQLHSLMDVINGTNPHWIRCIKPHPAKKALMWHGQQVFNQLSSSGVIGTVKVRKAGFPIRIYHDDFIKRFRMLCPGPVEDKKHKCEGICNDTLKSTEWFSRKFFQIGTARVFLKNEAYFALEEAINSAAGKYIECLQKWSRMWLCALLMQEKNFELNKASILESIKATLKLQQEEAKARQEILNEEAGALSAVITGQTQTVEAGKRQAIRHEEDKWWQAAIDKFYKEGERIERERKRRIAEKEKYDKEAREKMCEEEEEARAAWTADEDRLWNMIIDMAFAEQYARDKCREDEKNGRNHICDEETDEWADIVLDLNYSYNMAKGLEQRRLAGEWKVLLEDVYSVQAERKAEWLAQEKYKYDSRRREMAERRRIQHMAESIPRSNTAEERLAFERKTKIRRDQQTARLSADADKQVDKMRTRKEILIGKDLARAKKVEKLRNEAIADEKKRWMYGKEDIYKHDALSQRLYSADRYPLHTHSNPPPPHLFSQTQRSTSEEIFVNRLTPPGSPEWMQQGGGGTPRQGQLVARGHEGPYSPETEPLFSPVRTRAAAGLDLNGNPVNPMSPQPNPISPPKLGNYPSHNW